MGRWGFKSGRDYPANAAQEGLDWPVLPGVGEEDFADALLGGAVVPAGEQGQVRLADGWAGLGTSLREGFKCCLHAGFEDIAARFWRAVGFRNGLD